MNLAFRAFTSVRTVVQILFFVFFCLPLLTAAIALWDDGVARVAHPSQSAIASAGLAVRQQQMVM